MLIVADVPPLFHTDSFIPLNTFYFVESNELQINTQYRPCVCSCSLVQDISSTQPLYSSLPSLEPSLHTSCTETEGVSFPCVSLLLRKSANAPSAKVRQSAGPPGAVLSSESGSASPLFGPIVAMIVTRVFGDSIAPIRLPSVHSFAWPPVQQNNLLP